MDDYRSERAGHRAGRHKRVEGVWFLASVLSISAVIVGIYSLTRARAESPSNAASPSTQPGSGIYGAVTAAFGNAPAQIPPPAECVKVFDAAGEKVVARGICSGVYGSFRVPLAPGRYVVEFGGSVRTENGVAVFRPYREAIEVKTDQWISLMPAQPANPLP